MRYRLFFFFFFSINILVGQTIISLQVNKRDTLTFEYYQPFDSFSNEDIPTIRRSKFNGEYLFYPNIETPTFIKIKLNFEILEILISPGDSINLIVEGISSGRSKHDWLKFTGSNYVGNQYYNLVYNKVRYEKFLGIDALFDEYTIERSELLTKKIDEEISKNCLWIDSLRNGGYITKDFAEYMGIQIQSLLAWEVGEQCNKYFELRDPLSKISYQIKQNLFLKYNPFDLRLRTCMATGYYHTYYEETYKRSYTNIDSSKIIVKDTPFYSIADEAIQPFLWGNSLCTNYLYNPDRKENCSSFKKYRIAYPTSAYVSFLESQNMCSEVVKTEIKILELPDFDLFTFLRLAFSGKRVLIDLWATWCKPCKIEFVNYNDSFYQFLNMNKVELLFLSVDKQELKDKWLDEVRRYNLRGNHYLVGPKLLKSVNQVIYEDSMLTIPRYVLVGEDGEILSTNLTRPSDNEFRDNIKKLLN